MDITNLDTLVFSGGGVRGISYIGCILAFKDTYNKTVHSHFHTFVGTSVGALFALCCALDADVSKLLEDFQQFGLQNIFEKNPTWLLTNFALSDASSLRGFLEQILVKKGLSTSVTFGELYRIYNKKLVVTVVDLLSAKVMYLDYETSENMPVLLAVQGSMALPPVFPGVSYKQWCFIDGGLLDAFPIRQFCPSKTLGISTAWYIDPSNPLKDLPSYYTRILSILQLPLFEKEQDAYSKYHQTIAIDLGNVSADNACIDPQELIFKGYRTAIARFMMSYQECATLDAKKFLLM